MSTDPDDPRTDDGVIDEGGPVKSFLDHLEDLRWVLIKTLAALGIGMLICLVAGDHVVNILKKNGATDVKLTVYPETKHDSWKEAYKGTALYEWFLSHSLPDKRRSGK